MAILTGKVRGDERLDVDEDKYVSDPLSRAVTMSGVTLHLPYDSTRPEPSLKEKIGVVVAGIITPSGGVAIGGSYGWRGFSVAVTYGWIWVNTAPDGKVAGDDVVKDRQLVRGTSRGY